MFGGSSDNIFSDEKLKVAVLNVRLTMESSSSVITPEDVMGTLMNDGTIDSMRLKIITQLKANEELKNTTIKMVEPSRVLNTPVFCRLSEREAPLFVSAFGPQPEKGKEKKSGQKEESSETGKDNSESAAKKRKMNTEEEFDEAVCKSSDKSPSSDDSSKMPPPSGCDASVMLADRNENGTVEREDIPNMTLKGLQLH
ncbi:hypothetical protein H5410_008796 [Solanum commersonii]|uniref:Uncharacterized protein n=1 Tax=Solanum commersonii TaxID=4109 RepID=A0A9J6AHM8_SOLCO|nr:hypothetical protein H5410_008796 [Solanum commersonii]